MTYEEKKPIYEGHSLINFIIHLVMKGEERSKNFDEVAHGVFSEIFSLLSLVN